MRVQAHAARPGSNAAIETTLGRRFAIDPKSG
jgi:hypothetical protein